MTQKKKNRIFWLYRFILWFLAGTLLLAITVGFYLFFNAERLLNENLSDFIYQKTDSIYRLEFDEISFNYKNRSITFSNVALKPDTVSGPNSLSKHYEFETNYLTITGIKLKELLKEKSFHAYSLKVNNPNFRLSTGQDVEIKMFNSQKIEKGDSLILPFVKEILIDTILVTNARLKIDTLSNHRKTPNVNLEILQFKIGGKKLTDSPFPFDVSDISLKIENLQEKLADNIHIITVDELSLSLLHSRIKAKNILLKPINDSLKTSENQFKIIVPEIEINSPHVENFYLSDTIPIDKLTFTSPVIEIKFGKRVRIGTPINEINLYKLIEKKLKWINIGQFSIRNAGMKLYPANSDEAAQQFDNLNIDFTQFRVDANSYKDKNRIFSSCELAISIEHFTLNHTDKVHQLVISNLNAETKDKKVSAGIISFRPVNPSNKLIKTVNTLIDIECKGATFNGVQFNKMYHNQIISMDELAIRSPEANISFEKVNLNNKSSKDLSLILQKTSDYLKGVYVKKTSIIDGALNYNYILGENKNGFFRTKFQFELKGLSLDSITFYHSNKIFFADNFNVQFKDIGLQLSDDFHRLQTDSILISSEGKNAEIYNFRILPIKTLPKGDSLFLKGQPGIFDIHFPIIQLSGVDLHKAFFHKELSVSNFNIFNPSFNIEFVEKLKVDNSTSSDYKNVLYPIISDYLFKINIETLKMDNGYLNLSQHRKGQTPIEISNAFSIKFFNFEIDSLSSQKENKLFFSDNIDLILKKYSFTLADGVYKVDAEEIGILSTEKRIYINNAKMYPDVLAHNFKKMPITVFATIPSVQLSDANIQGLFNTGLFDVTTTTLTNPQIKLMFQPDIKQNPDSTKSAKLIINGLKSFTNDQVIIKNGTLELSNYTNLKSKTFATTTIDLTLKKFKVENEQNAMKPKYGDFSFTLNNTQFDLSDKTHHLSIGKTNYRSSDGLLKITNFKIQPGKDVLLKDKQELYTLHFPEITFTDLNIIKYIDEKKIVSSSLTINNPTVELTDNSVEKNKGFDPYKINLYPKIKSFIETIEIAQVSVNKANVSLINSKPIHINQMNLSGKSLLVDKNSDLNGNLLMCKNLFVELNNLNGKTKDGFYNYGIEKIYLNELGNFSLTGMSLIPAYSEAEFNRKKIYQADYITINNADCLGRGLNLKRFIEKNEIIIGESNITLDKVEIYRNNHYPIPPNLKIEMPQKELRELKQKFLVDSILINCKRFNYRELEPQATNETKLFFTDINSTITHLTNIKQNLIADPFAHLKLNGELMGKGAMNVKIDLNIISPENLFRVRAECGQMPLDLMNPVTEPGMKLSIKEGANNQMSAYFEANEDTSFGSMKFSYSDLKISVLSDKDGLMNEDKFISFLANTFAVKSDNPRQGRVLTPVDIKARHDSKRSFINYCWVSLFSGIKNTFGMKEKEE